ncbi:MAG: OmpA family protein [Deltaproteobacteria bacterium]|nr:OmpA family protein [Deltaproteobacteria bacterium]
MATPRPTKRFLTLTRGALTALGLLTLAAPAAAQQEQLNRFDQPVAGDTFMSVFGPNVNGHLVARGLATFDYGHRALALTSGGQDFAVLSRSQTFLHVGGSLALWDRMLVSLDLPIALSQTGENAELRGKRIFGTDGAGLGELRLGLRGRLYGDQAAPFSVGIGAMLYLPTATDAWTGEGYAYGEPQLLLGGRVPYFTYSAFVGSQIRQSQDPTSLTFGAGAAASLLDNALTVGPEVRGSYNLTKPDLIEGIIPRDEATSAEVRLGAQYRFLDSFVVGAAGGIGVASAIGTTEFRVLGRVAFDPQKTAPKDGDLDGIVDESDACPTIPGVPSVDPTQHGCPLPPPPPPPPPADTDLDGVIDPQDACPTVPGIMSADPTKHGCPSDRDGDGLLDSADACPDVAGTAPDGCADSDKDGVKDPVDSCPTQPGIAPTGCPDTDGDGILDPKDACPNEKGVASDIPEKHGCARLVLTDKEIVIKETIEFEKNKATILPVSESILELVASAMKEHAEIELIEVQGHTDDAGIAPLNRGLSQRRAKEVVDALVKKGVDKKRLVAKGFGADKPLINEKTDAARAKNRRVQFMILKRGGASVALDATGDKAKAAVKAVAPIAKPAAPAKPGAPTPAKPGAAPAKPGAAPAKPGAAPAKPGAAPAKPGAASAKPGKK